MTEIFAILWIMFAHWIADFHLQTRWEAANKWENVRALTYHVLVYTFTMMFAGLVLWWLWGPFSVMAWTLGNGVLHWITDYYTSKQTHKYFFKEDYHNGFVWVGIDQFIHYACLFISWKLLL